MVNIKREKVEDYGACNFCTRGEVKKSGFGLKYPY